MDGCGLGAQEPDEKSGFPVVQKIRLDDHSTPSQKTQTNRPQLTRDAQKGVAPKGSPARGWFGCSVVFMSVHFDGVSIPLLISQLKKSSPDSDRAQGEVFGWCQSRTWLVQSRA